jgi:hypothetical protein
MGSAKLLGTPKISDCRDYLGGRGLSKTANLAGAEFHFDQAPALILKTLQHVNADENFAVLERTLKYRWNFRVLH